MQCRLKITGNKKCHQKPSVVMIPTLLSLVGPEVVITTTSTTASNDKVGIKATFTFHWSHHVKSTHESYLEYEDAEESASCQTSNMSHTLVDSNKFVDHSDVFFLKLTPDFNGLGKDNSKTRREIFEFWQLVWLILEVWQYILNIWQAIDCANGDTNISWVTAQRSRLDSVQRPQVSYQYSHAGKMIL